MRKLRKNPAFFTPDKVWRADFLMEAGTGSP